MKRNENKNGKINKRNASGNTENSEISINIMEGLFNRSFDEHR